MLPVSYLLLGCHEEAWEMEELAWNNLILPQKWYHYEQLHPSINLWKIWTVLPEISLILNNFFKQAFSVHVPVPSTDRKRKLGDKSCIDSNWKLHLNNDFLDKVSLGSYSFTYKVYLYLLTVAFMSHCRHFPAVDWALMNQWIEMR